MLHQQAHDVAKPQISGLRHVDCGRPGARRFAHELSRPGRCGDYARIPAKQQIRQLLCRLRECCCGMSQRILPFGCDVHRSRRRWQSQHDGGFSGRVGSDDAARERSRACGEQDRAAAALPPDCPGFSVTERVNWLPAAPFCLSPVLVNDAGGLPTRMYPPCCCATPVGVGARNTVVIEARVASRSYGDLSVVSLAQRRL